MKRLFVLFVFFLLASVAVSAQTTPDVLKYVPKFIKFDKTKTSDAYFTIDRVLTTGYEDKISQDWVNNNWLNVDRIIEQWDTNVGTTESVNMKWDTLNGVWVNTMKFYATFASNPTDSTFRFLSMDMYTWDGSAWILYVTTVYTYDVNNFLTEINSSLSLGGNMILFTKVSYTNNSVGYPLTEVMQLVNFTTFQLENEEMNTYIYLPGNPKYLTDDVRSVWDGSVWIDTSKTRYTRNSKLNPTLEIESDIYGGSTVLDINKIESVYRADDEQLASEMIFGWNVGSSVWDIHSRRTYTYTTFNKLDVMLIEDYTNNAYVPWLRSTYTYDSMEREILEQTEIYVARGFENHSRKITSYTPSAVGDESNVVNGFVLEQNYPNPFNPNTHIKFAITGTQNVSLKVYDVLGNEIATLLNEEKAPGTYNVTFNGRNFSSGVYFYSLSAGDFHQTKKMIVLK